MYLVGIDEDCTSTFDGSQPSGTCRTSAPPLCCESPPSSCFAIHIIVLTLRYAFRARFVQLPLGLNPSASCYLLKLKNVSILLDCGAEFSSLLDFMPLGLNSCGPKFHSSLPPLEGVEAPRLDAFVVDQLDYVLISNFYNMTCLPYLTEYCGFKGKIYATEPTVQLGRQLLLELSSQVLNAPLSPASLSSSASSLSFGTSSSLDLYRKMYSESEIHACFSKIESCSFEQRLVLLDGLVASPHSSGYCLGSANWVVATEYERVVYAAQNVFSSGSVRFHAQPLHAKIFSNADCVIMSQFAIPEMVDLDAHFGDLCSQIGQTLAMGGTVLLPVSNAGIILDLFAILDTYMVQTGLNPNTSTSGLAGMTSSSTPQIPMYYVSSISEAVLAYANISAEWLDATKQERVYTPNNPFTHSDLLDADRLFRFDRLSQLSSNASNTSASSTSAKTGGIPPISRSPCIIFCGHPSLRFGDIVPLIETIKLNPKNTIIFTDPNYDPKKAFAPFDHHTQSIPGSGVQCKLHFCPLDSRITYKAAAELMKRYAPRRLIVPSEEAKNAIGNLPHNTEVISMKHDSEIKIKLKRKYERGYITPELAAILEPTTPTTITATARSGNANSPNIAPDIFIRETNVGVSITSIRATLNHRDGSYTIAPLTHHQQRTVLGSDRETSLVDDVKMEVDAHHPPHSSSSSSSSSSSFSSTHVKQEACNYNRKPRRLFGTISPQDILALLEEMSVDQVEIIEISDSRAILKFPQLEATLEMEGSKTKIVASKEESRKLLKEVLLRLLN